MEGLGHLNWAGDAIPNVIRRNGGHNAQARNPNGDTLRGVGEDRTLDRLRVYVPSSDGCTTRHVV